MSMAGCRPLDQGLTRGGKQDEPQPGKQIPTRGRHGRPSSNPCPWEVQDAVSTLSAVQEVAVVGIPDERWGETVKAVIAVRPGYELTEEDVVRVCTDRVSSYNSPRSVEFADELPKTGRGKVLRR